MNKSMLIIGDCCDDKWIGGFLRNCAFHKEGIDVFCANTNYSTDYFSDFNSICKCVFNIKRNAPSLLYSLPIIRRLLYFLDIKILLSTVFRFRDFDVVNIHYVIPELATTSIKTHTKCLVLTPWGSDVLRRSKLELLLIKRVFNQCQYITVQKTRFREDIKTLLLQPDSKCIDLGMGTDMIDFIDNNRDYTREQAKHDLGIGDKYVIVCGYNAHPEQNHFSIIDAIYSIKEMLPSNTLLLLPMTYGSPQWYKDSVKDYINNKGLECLVFNDFLTPQKLLGIRKCADIFIHAQKTDNNSGSLAEHLLCGSKVLNAAWLKYPQYEKFGTSYYTFNSFEELPQVLLTTIKDENIIVQTNVKEYIKESGWNRMSVRWRTFINKCIL